jgi:hypothetical protein
MIQGVLYVVALLCLKTLSADKTSNVDPTVVLTTSSLNLIPYNCIITLYKVSSPITKTYKFLSFITKRYNRFIYNNIVVL